MMCSSILYSSCIPFFSHPKSPILSYSLLLPTLTHPPGSIGTTNDEVLLGSSIQRDQRQGTLSPSNTASSPE